jgi:hypothetical protein
MLRKLGVDRSAFQQMTPLLLRSGVLRSRKGGLREIGPIFLRSFVNHAVFQPLLSDRGGSITKLAAARTMNRS